jgi:MinD-like ATPase involved in chromosome partitioning or flagellar assembly
VNNERYVLLGLAPARAPWFGALAQWATSATIAAEFIKCVSPAEVRVRLASGRRHSALLIDARLPSLDRDMIDASLATFTPVIIVGDPASLPVPLDDLGAAAVLAPDFSQDDLLDLLAAACQPVGHGDVLPPALDYWDVPVWMGRLFTVCGPGGTGASTVAIALAQGLSTDARYARRVLLADLARRADQAMLHDAQELGPGVQELVEAHRLGRMGPDDISEVTFSVPRRGYRLLLGLRRPEGWSALRPRAIDAAVEGLRRSFQVVVADVTGDVEGEADGGSADVEERNHLARTSVLHSSAVVAVGAPGMKGIHSLASLVRSLVTAGVAPARIVPVVNRAPRNPAARATLARAFAELLADQPASALAGPVHLPERKIEDALRDGTPLPAAVVDPVVRAVLAVAERQADSAPADQQATPITPGSLGAWSAAAELDT